MTATRWKYVISFKIVLFPCWKEINTESEDVQIINLSFVFYMLYIKYIPIPINRLITMSELKRILYAEDEPDIQSIAKIALQMAGGFEFMICYLSFTR